MYILSIKPEVDKIFAKLYKKNKKQYEIIMITSTNNSHKAE